MFSGPTRYRQDCNFSDDRLPAGQAKRRTRPGLRPVEHGRGSADGEDRQDRSQDRPGLRKVQRSYRVARRALGPAQSD